MLVTSAFQECPESKAFRCARASSAVRPSVLSVHDDDDRIFSALCAGASGYLLKKTPLPV